MSKRKLLIITDLYPDFSNPIGGIFVKHQVDELSRYYEVFVFATHMIVEKSGLGLQQQSATEYHHYMRIIRSLFLINSIKYRILVIPQIQRVIKETQPDIIHVHDCRHVPELVNLAPMLHALKIPHFLSMHNIKTHPAKISNHFLRMIYTALMPRSFRGWKAVFTVNDQLKGQISPYTSTSNIHVVGNAIKDHSPVHTPLIDEVSMFLYGASLKLIGVGNLIPTKGFDLLISAVASLIAEGQDIRLVIIGDGDQREHLNGLILKQNLQERIHLLGRVDNEILRNLYPLFDVFILPSYSETFGIVYLEAMAAGLLTVGVKGVGIDGIIQNGINGFLVEPKSIKSIESIIHWLLAHPIEATDIAAAGKKLVERDYRIEQLCRVLRSYYES